MLALVAAIVFGLALLFDFLNVHAGDAFTWQTLATLGLLLLALHLAGIGRPWRGSDRRA